MIRSATAGAADADLEERLAERVGRIVGYTLLVLIALPGFLEAGAGELLEWAVRRLRRLLRFAGSSDSAIADGAPE